MKSDVIDQLFSQYYNEALLYTISLCRKRTVAEDIVSTAFFKALTLSDDSIRSFKPWLLAVCRNEFISLCRKNSRFTGEDIPEDLADGREELIESVIRREEYRSLYRAIGLLAVAAIVCGILFIPSNLSASGKVRISKEEAVEAAYACLVEQVGEEEAKGFYVDYAHRHLRYVGSIFDAVYVYRVEFEDAHDREYDIEVNSNSGYTVIRDVDIG